MLTLVLRIFCNIFYLFKFMVKIKKRQDLIFLVMFIDNVIIFIYVCEQHPVARYIFLTNVQSFVQLQQNLHEGRERLACAHSSIRQSRHRLVSMNYECQAIIFYYAISVLISIVYSSNQLLCFKVITGKCVDGLRSNLATSRAAAAVIACLILALTQNSHKYYIRCPLNMNITIIFHLPLYLCLKFSYRV